MTAQNSTATIKFFNAVDDDTDSDSDESTAAPSPKPHKNGYVLKPVVFMLKPLLFVQKSSIEQNPIHVVCFGNPGNSILSDFFKVTLGPTGRKQLALVACQVSTFLCFMSFYELTNLV